MATPTKVQLEVENTGIFKFKPQTVETATRTSELLQENHDKHHIFFNPDGFHNHIAHHLLTLYGLGAPVAVIEKAYEDNVSYQRKPVPVDERVIQDMSNSETFKKYLGKEKYYHDFLIFFQNEMEKKGWENVLNEYIFAGNESSDDLFGRLYAGFLHPIIHLGFGLEFKQPAIIAEALAQACVHDNWMSVYLLKAEQAARSPNQSNSKTIPEILDEIRTNKKLSTAADWGDGNKIRDGILVRAPEEMLEYATRWTVSPDTLEEKTVEMMCSAIYFAAAAQNPPKQVKFDFYYMHCANASLFFPTFNAQSWLSTASKVRLLQNKVYTDLTMYASRRSPPLLLEEISLYTPKLLEAGDAEWPGLFERLYQLRDDGHAVKLARAVAVGEQYSKPYEGEGRREEMKWVKIKGFMWEKIGNMVVDSVEDTGAKWARSVGFKEAWEEYEDRPRQVHL